MVNGRPLAAHARYQYFVDTMYNWKPASLIASGRDGSLALKPGVADGQLLAVQFATGFGIQDELARTRGYISREKQDREEADDKLQQRIEALEHHNGLQPPPDTVITNVQVNVDGQQGNPAGAAPPPQGPPAPADPPAGSPPAGGANPEGEQAPPPGGGQEGEETSPPPAGGSTQQPEAPPAPSGGLTKDDLAQALGGMEGRIGERIDTRVDQAEERLQKEAVEAEARRTRQAEEAERRMNQRLGAQGERLNSLYSWAGDWAAHSERIHWGIAIVLAIILLCLLSINGRLRRLGIPVGPAA
ncbi:hypothetical protein HY375_02280 [Candidatus Berkelbacteria bacterium]|nr:hypothetical protein [Candidatus Berkelbacteria bacterium]